VGLVVSVMVGSNVVLSVGVGVGEDVLFVVGILVVFGIVGEVVNELGDNDEGFIVLSEFGDKVEISASMFVLDIALAVFVESVAMTHGTSILFDIGEMNKKH